MFTFPVAQTGAGNVAQYGVDDTTSRPRLSSNFQKFVFLPVLCVAHIALATANQEQPELNAQAHLVLRCSPGPLCSADRCSWSFSVVVQFA